MNPQTLYAEQASAEEKNITELVNKSIETDEERNWLLNLSQHRRSNEAKNLKEIQRRCEAASVLLGLATSGKKVATIEAVQKALAAIGNLSLAE